MYVPLEHETLKDGRLHVQIAIIPDMEEKYTINVLDQQKKRTIATPFRNAPGYSNCKEAITIRPRRTASPPLGFVVMRLYE